MPSQIESLQIITQASLYWNLTKYPVWVRSKTRQATTMILASWLSRVRETSIWTSATNRRSRTSTIRPCEIGVWIWASLIRDACPFTKTCPLSARMAKYLSSQASSQCERMPLFLPFRSSRKSSTIWSTSSTISRGRESCLLWSIWVSPLSRSTTAPSTRPTIIRTASNRSRSWGRATLRKWCLPRRGRRTSHRSPSKTITITYLSLCLAQSRLISRTQALLEPLLAIRTSHTSTLTKSTWTWTHWTACTNSRYQACHKASARQAKWIKPRSRPQQIRPTFPSAFPTSTSVNHA